ncbi:MAG: glycosyltransferase [Candidatus Roizmanbacteria bacterium]|nr:glycosyltransferase [Candidatus Roizmanbacteria bacterium]
MEKKYSFYVIASLFTGIVYILWLYIIVDTLIATVFFVLEFAIFFMFVLFVINHSKKRYQLHGGPYSLRAMVDIFIPTKNEPITLLERTIKSASKIISSKKRIYVIDDSDRAEVKKLCSKYHATYLVRPDRKTKAYKAASLNYAFSKSFGNFILTLDADQWVANNILDDLLGHFKNDKVAIVATRQMFDVPEGDFNHDHLFYGHMQPGKNAYESAISCGSGVIYRRSALDEIQGFQEWNIVEDLYTSYVLNQHGYKSIYISQAYTKGEAPIDLKTIYKQRGTWALDTLRMFFWKQSLWDSTLSFRQKILYFETGYIYLISALVIPSLYLINFYSLYTNTPILTVGIWYLVLRLPSFFLTMKVYYDLGKGSANSRMWTSLFPVFFLSTIKALLYVKPTYIVTKKGVSPKKNILLILPQFITILVGVVGLFYNLVNHGLTSFLLVNFFWTGTMCYWLWPVFPKAFLINTNEKPQALTLLPVTATS